MHTWLAAWSKILFSKGIYNKTLLENQWDCVEKWYICKSSIATVLI
jgi:hypothetical protein